MSATPSFYESRRGGKGRTPGDPGAADLDAAGALLHHLKQLDTQRVDVAALVREVERAERDGALLCDEPVDGVTSADVPGASMSAASASIPHTWHGAAKRARNARRSGLAVDVPLNATAWNKGPSLALPFLLVGAVIIAGLGVPAFRHRGMAVPAASLAASSPAVAPDTAPRVGSAAPAGGQARDEQAVHAVVASYADAYGRRDVAAVRALYPTQDAGALTQSFAGLRDVRVQVLNEQIQITGDTATVSCVWQVLAETNEGTLHQAESPAVLTLERHDGTWRIANRY